MPPSSRRSALARTPSFAHESLATIFARVGPLLCLAFFLLAAGGVRTAHGDAALATAQAAVLRARYEALHAQLAHSPFRRPLHLESAQGTDGLTGEIYAVVEYPFEASAAALGTPANWCDILILHLNVKYCRASADTGKNVLTVYVGRKYDQPLARAYRVEFAYRLAAATPDYLQAVLTADQGPFGTKDYRITLEAIPLGSAQTFLRFTYSYSDALVARLAMQAYLGTLGAHKVGFTVLGTDSEGKPEYVAGVRGAVERNTMRYYLAVDAYLNALSAPPREQLEKRLRDWFASTERFPLQLHEMDELEYLSMKRKETERQRAAP